MNYAGRNVTDELLKIGLAKFTEWNATPTDLERQKEFEKAAIKQGVRLWKGYVEPTIEEYLGKVREVQSSGNLVVSDLSVEPPVKKNVSLSSVMVPRFGVPGKDDEPWGWEAKEYLRKNLIGKKVRVLVDYKRTAPSPSLKDSDPKAKLLPDRIYVTILLEKTNIALKLVEEGLARVVPHKVDEKRSIYYEALLIAEQAAKKKLKAINGKPENAPKHFINDVSGDSQKAKQFLPSFQRAGKQIAVVDWVLSGSKFKLFVPKETCAVTFTLSGVKVPGRDELCSEEALIFAREKTHQYDIEIEVESVDRGGNMVGNLYVKKKNFAITLLENGFAFVHEASIDRSPYKEEYINAELSAKKSKLNIWVNHTEEEETKKKL